MPRMNKYSHILKLEEGMISIGAHVKSRLREEAQFLRRIIHPGQICSPISS